jgi:hypothetical protein
VQKDLNVSCFALLCFAWRSDIIRLEAPKLRREFTGIGYLSYRHAFLLEKCVAKTPLRKKSAQTHQEKDKEFRKSFGVLPPRAYYAFVPPHQKNGAPWALVANSFTSVTFSKNTLCSKQLIEMVAFPAPSMDPKVRAV